MSQQVFQNINPVVTTGLMLAGILDDFKDALMSGLSGTARPVSVTAGGLWVDTSLESAPNYKWSLKLFNGTADVTVLDIDVLTGASGFNRSDSEFTIRRVSTDAIGPILNLMKSRVSDGGQALEDDIIARVNLIGYTDTATSPIVAYIQVVAAENMTNSGFGAAISFASTPTGTNAVSEHLSMHSGILESLLAHRFEALLYGQTAVTATANMSLSAETMVTELKGTVEAIIHGVESSDGSKYKIVINDTDKTVTVKNESATVDAEDRSVLPGGTDLSVTPGGAATFFYSTATSRWKYVTGTLPPKEVGSTRITGAFSQWVSPLTGTIRITPVASKTSSRTSRHALTSSAGVTRAWGRNTSGQLGDGTSVSKSTPVLVVGTAQKNTEAFEDTSFGNGYTDNNLYAWGNNNKGQLGDGTTVSKSSPVAVLGGLKAVKVFNNGTTSYGLLPDGTTYAWGEGTSGQLGDGTIVAKSSPVAVVGGLKFSRVAAGGTFALAIEKTGGALYAWGSNTSGVLGLGDTLTRSSPVLVASGSTFKKVVLSGNSAIGLKSDGTVHAWGDNSAGQLGDGTVVSKSSPVQIYSANLVADVVSDRDGAFFLRTEAGDIYAWGKNTNGQLGDGTVANKSTPTLVIGGIKFDDIAASVGAVIASSTDEKLYSWGADATGRLGHGVSADTSSPVLVTGSLSFSNANIGPDVTLAKATDQLTYGFGTNTDGQVGDNSTTSRNAPTAVATNPASFDTNSEPAWQFTMSVQKGVTYPVRLGPGICSFGNIAIADNVNEVTITYGT